MKGPLWSAIFMRGRLISSNLNNHNQHCPSHLCFLCVWRWSRESKVINDSRPTADSNGLAAISVGHPLVRGKISELPTLMGLSETSSNKVFQLSHLDFWTDCKGSSGQVTLTREVLRDNLTYKCRWFCYVHSVVNSLTNLIFAKFLFTSWEVFRLRNLPTRIMSVTQKLVLC